MDNKNIQEEISQILMQFKEKEENVIAVAVINQDGISVCSIFPPSFDKDTIAMIISSTMKVGEKSMRELGGKGLKRMLLKNSHGLIVLQNIANAQTLFVLADNEIKPASLLLASQELAVKIG